MAPQVGRCAPTESAFRSLVPNARWVGPTCAARRRRVREFRAAGGVADVGKLPALPLDYARADQAALRRSGQRARATTPMLEAKYLKMRGARIGGQSSSTARPTLFPAENPTSSMISSPASRTTLRKRDTV